MFKSFFVILGMLLGGVAAADAQVQDLSVSESQNSGCLSKTRGSDGESAPTIVLKKEGDILFVELHNYYGNCGTTEFLIKANVTEDGNEPITVSIDVDPVVPNMMDCTCPFNVTFTVWNLELNRFHLNCWWCDGMVELTEGETLVVKKESATVDGLQYTIVRSINNAMLKIGNKWEGELSIPSEFIYEGEKYVVTSIADNVFGKNTTLTKITIPHTVKNLDFNSDEGFYKYPFHGCLALKWVDVEEGNPAVCSVDGVLFDKKMTKLLGYPAASEQVTYNVPLGINRIDDAAFRDCVLLHSLDISESVKYIGIYSFYGCILEDLYIRGVLDSDCLNNKLFKGLDTKTKVHVQASEVEKYQAIYQGTVLPIPSSEETLGITDINQPFGKQTESYDLQGRRLTDKPSKGVYIENGQKKVVK